MVVIGFGSQYFGIIPNAIITGEYKIFRFTCKKHNVEVTMKV